MGMVMRHGRRLGVGRVMQRAARATEELPNAAKQVVG